MKSEHVNNRVPVVNTLSGVSWSSVMLCPGLQATCVWVESHSFGYPGDSTFKRLSSAWGKKRSAFVTALPQIRVETLIGSQANYEIKIKITIYFYKIIISYEKYSTLKLY